MTGDAFAVEWQPDVGARRKLRFEPVDERWLRVEYEWNGCQWREVGNELVDDVELESDAEIVA
jgi:hypothetical protein